MRTLSATQQTEDSPTDLDNQVVDGIESLRQRLDQRLKFMLGEWDLDRRRGTESVLGHEYTPDLAASVLTAAIRDEGGDEVTGVDAEIDYSRTTRIWYYSAQVASIYGPMTITGVAI